MRIDDFSGGIMSIPSYHDVARVLLPIGLGVLGGMCLCDLALHTLALGSAFRPDCRS